MSTAELETKPKAQRIVVNQDSVPITVLGPNDRLVIRPSGAVCWKSEAEAICDRWDNGSSLILPHDWTIEIIRVTPAQEKTRP